MMFHIWDDSRIYVLSKLGMHSILTDQRRWRKSIRNSIDSPLEETARTDSPSNSIFGTIWKLAAPLVF